ncbi:dopamine receptor 2-like [Lycorma delicatula]|uniref:dopamine receptor 2-like n=1 Tax=Lycorma delicatula TaxID=130591 RepID=UPI003F5156EE
MTKQRACLLIAAVWVCSSAISFPAILWWRAVRIEDVPQFQCPFTDSLGYLVFSSTISFYVPLFVMVFTYYKIYRAAAYQTRSLKMGSKQVMELTLRMHRGGGENGLARPGKNFSLSRKLSKFAKEKKAAKTLGIVMGVFTVCWLPFFVVNLLSGFCADCIWQADLVSAIVTWLGWLNSGMNPVIYACWSKDFRR